MEAPDEPAKLTLDFQAGVPVRVKNVDDGTEISDSVQMYVCNNVSCDHVVCVFLSTRSAVRRTKSVLGADVLISWKIVSSE